MMITVAQWTTIFSCVWLFVQYAEAWVTPINCGTRTSKSRNTALMASGTDAPRHRRELLQRVGALGTALVAQPVWAERTLSTVTESYKRYVPRMEAGFQFLVSDLKDMVADGKTQDVVAEITAERGTKMSAMKGTMKIFATAFSDSVVSQVTRELQLATLKTSNELDNVVESLKGGDTEKALEALRQSLFFAQVYAETANAAIPRSLDPIRGPQGVGKRLTERDTSVVGGF